MRIPACPCVPVWQSWREGVWHSRALLPGARKCHPASADSIPLGPAALRLGAGGSAVPKDQGEAGRRLTQVLIRPKLLPRA